MRAGRVLLVGKIGQIGSKISKMTRKNQLIRHVNIHTQQSKALVDPMRAVLEPIWSCCLSDINLSIGKLLVFGQSVYKWGYE